MWSSTSSSPARHVGDTPSTSDIKVGKKKMTVKFPCMLCKGDHYSHLCPCMDEASSLLENLQLPTSYCKISLNPSLVDGMFNLVPSPISLVDQVVNLVSSLVEILTQVVDLVSSSINPTFHLKSETRVPNLVLSSINSTLHQKSETKVVDLVSPSVDPTLHLKSDKVVDLITSSVNPTLPLKSAKVVVPVTSLINATPPLKSAKEVDTFPPIDPILPLENETQVVDLIYLSVDPTLTLESKPDTAYDFLIGTEFTMPGGNSSFSYKNSSK
jgi:hypothetical protein